MPEDTDGHRQGRSHRGETVFGDGSGDTLIGKQEGVPVDNPRQRHRAHGLTVVMGINYDVWLDPDAFRGTGDQHGLARGDTLKYAGDWGGDGHQTLKTSRASVIWPVIAAAATIKGLIRIVRPVCEPWRPLKLRFEELAQS